MGSALMARQCCDLYASKGFKVGVVNIYKYINLYESFLNLRCYKRWLGVMYRNVVYLPDREILMRDSQWPVYKVLKRIQSNSTYLK